MNTSLIALMLMIPYGSFHAVPAAIRALATRPSVSGKLMIAADGTATATGIVLENNHGCEIDAICYLRLKVGDHEVRVVYDPGKSGVRDKNKTASEQGFAVKKGSHVAIYGKYTKQSNTIEIYSSETFYVRVLTD